MQKAKVIGFQCYFSSPNSPLALICHSKILMSTNSNWDLVRASWALSAGPSISTNIQESFLAEILAPLSTNRNNVGDHNDRRIGGWHLTFPWPWRWWYQQQHPELSPLNYHHGNRCDPQGVLEPFVEHNPLNTTTSGPLVVDFVINSTMLMGKLTTGVDRGNPRSLIPSFCNCFAVVLFTPE